MVFRSGKKLKSTVEYRYSNSAEHQNVCAVELLFFSSNFIHKTNFIYSETRETQSPFELVSLAGSFFYFVVSSFWFDRVVCVNDKWFGILKSFDSVIGQINESNSIKSSTSKKSAKLLCSTINQDITRVQRI